MPHALVIEDNMVISKMIEVELVRAGFDSFEHSWTEEDAVAAAQRRVPDLVVVGDTLEAGSTMAAAQRIRSMRDVPVLLVTANAEKMRRSLPKTVSFDQRFALKDLARAVAAAAEA